MIEAITAWLVQVVDTLSYGGIIFLMALESTFLPLIPSELVLIPAGIASATGVINPWGAVGAGALGSVLGALLNYYLAARYGKQVLYPLFERYGNYCFINMQTIHKAERLFLQNSIWATFIGRLLLGIRHFISLPAGFVRMPLLSFSVTTFLGAGLWAGMLVGIGYAIHDPARIEAILSTFTLVSLGTIGLIIFLFYYLYTRMRG
jgi:membrane protein DedA with SNARE-associated domain